MSYRLAEEFMWKEIKGRVVVLHLDSGKYYSLNPTGSMIWKGVLDDQPIEQIVDELCAAYDVDSETARQDAQEMIRSFEARKLIIKK